MEANLTRLQDADRSQASSDTQPKTVACCLLHRVLNALNDEGIRYCVLRDGHQLHALADGGELDLLVDPAQLLPVLRLLERLHFAHLPNRGHRPHHFLVGYDPDRDAWIKIDLVTRLAFGRPVQTLQTSLARRCLAERRLWGPAYVPSPLTEFQLLLLHCLLDKGRISPSRRQRLQALSDQLAPHELDGISGSEWPWPVSGRQLRQLVQTGQWTTVLQFRPHVVRHLAQGRWLAIAVEHVVARFLRKWSHVLCALRQRPMTIALLAPDGAGKSTLAAGIQANFFFPVACIYMGLYSAARRRPQPGLPGVGLARRILALWGRYLLAVYHRARGRFVLFDRYGYDTLLAAARQRTGRLRRWRRWLLAHACPAPSLVIVLDVPGRVLFARKGEHSEAVLEQQRQQYLQLAQQARHWLVLDATGRADAVRRAVTATIWQVYAARTRTRTGREGQA